MGSTPTPATNKKGENMSKEEWFEGHRIPKNNVYMIIIGKLPGNNTDVTTNKY